MNFLLSLPHFIKLVILVAYYRILPKDIYAFCFYLLLAPITLLGLVFNYRLSRGIRVQKCITNLGCLYIKLGQIMASREDVIPKDIMPFLTDLCDNISAVTSHRMKKYIIKVAPNLLNNFKSFDFNPCASASIAQVYKATLFSGEKVAVKVIKPNIKKKIKRELRYMYALASLLNKFSFFRRLKIWEVIQMLDHSLNRELDLRFEAAHSSMIKENLHKESFIIIPRIYWDYTFETILVSDFIEGVPVHDITKLDELGYDKKKIADKLLKAYFVQVYRDGFFHADMHQGNVLITKDQKIALIDFGIVSRLSEEDRIAVAQIVHGFIKADYLNVARVHSQAGYIDQDVSIEDFSIACRIIGEPLVGKDSDQILVSNILSVLFKITAEYGMKTQIQLLWLQKTMFIIEGIASKLHPGINFWQVLEPEFREWNIDNFGVSSKVKKSFSQGLNLTKSFPKTLSNVNNILDKINSNQQTNINDDVREKQESRTNYEGYRVKKKKISWVTVLVTLMLVLLIESDRNIKDLADFIGLVVATTTLIIGNNFKIILFGALLVYLLKYGKK